MTEVFVMPSAGGSDFYGAIQQQALLLRYTMVMDHEEFVSRTKEALQDQSAGRPEEGVVKLRALLQDLEPAMKTAVNDWHQQQALSLLVDALDSACRKEECRAAWKELIELNQRHQRYWQRSFTSASEDFESWNDSNSP